MTDSMKSKILASCAALAAAAALAYPPAAFANAKAIDCTGTKCIEAEPPTAASGMKPKQGGRLKGASLTPSKDKGGLGLKSGAKVRRDEGSRIVVRNGKSYSCTGDCAEEKQGGR